MKLPITKQLTIKVKSIFGNLTRPKHVLICLQDMQGNYHLGEKTHFYPPNIYRLIGGGVGEREEFLPAAIRELQEEVGLTLMSDQLTHLATIHTTASYQDKTYSNITQLYHHILNKPNQLQPTTDITGIIKHTPRQLQDLIYRYQHLPLDAWYTKGAYSHRWLDYAAMYAPIHQLTLNLA